MDESGDYTVSTGETVEPELCEPVDKSGATIGIMIVSLILIIAVGFKTLFMKQERNPIAPYERFVSTLASDSGWTQPELNPAFNTSTDTDDG
jgi:hypothetical protein